MSPKKQRNTRLAGETIELKTPCGHMYVTMNDDPDTGSPFELFIRFGKSGSCGSLVANSLARTASLALRGGIDYRDVIKDMIGQACHRAPVMDGEFKIRSCVDAIGQALRIHTGAEVEKDTEAEASAADDETSYGIAQLQEARK